jgi:hypothetical protein
MLVSNPTVSLVQVFKGFKIKVNDEAITITDLEDRLQGLMSHRKGDYIYRRLGIPASVTKQAKSFLRN